jgi:hypothetical protein
MPELTRRRSSDARGECWHSIGATFARARSKSAPAFPSMKIHGAGLAASADFQAWRDERDWTARKYAMWETGERMPSQKPSSLMRYPCGATIDTHRMTPCCTSRISPPPKRLMGLDAERNALGARTVRIYACRVLTHRVTFSLRHAITLPFWACVSWPAFRKAVADLNPGGGFSLGRINWQKLACLRCEPADPPSEEHRYSQAVLAQRN